MNLTDDLSDYEVEWEGNPISIQEAVTRLKKGKYPESLVIFHPMYGTTSFNLYGPYYSFGQSGPAPSRWGLARSSAIQPIMKESILPTIDYVFENISERVVKAIALYTGSQKLLRNRLNVAKQMMRKSGQNVPRNVEQIIFEQIGEKKPVTSSFNVPNNQARIQTNLFTNEVNMPRHLKKINTTLFNGGKRKSKKSRQTRRKYHK